MIRLDTIWLNKTNAKVDSTNFVQFNQILFDLTKDLSLLHKMVWLGQVNFFI